jgi:PAS domain S-box-containing protein
VIEESEQRYGQLFEGISDAVMVYSPQGRFLDCNEATLQRLGYGYEELLCLSAADIVHPDFHLMMKENQNRVWAGETTVVQSAYCCKDGGVIPVEVNARRIEYKGGSAILAVVRDITKRKRMQEALREQTVRNELILQTAIDSISVVDMEGNILEVNPAASIISGYSQEEMVGMNIRDLEAMETPQETTEHIKRFVKKGSDRFETKLRRKDGQIVDVEVSTNFMDMDGKRFLFSFFHDITTRKQAEQALKEREKDLEIKTANLEEVNAALKVLLKRREEDKIELEEKVLFNVRELIVPYIEKLKENTLDEKQKVYVNILDSNLNDIISPFSLRLSSRYLNFTPAQIQVANLVKHGKTTKEIADFLNLSGKTIEVHRKNIRRKIGIRNEKANLRTHLLSIQ